MLGYDVPLDIITLVRSFYFTSAAIILAVRSIPPLRDRFLDYGARNNPSAPSPDPGRTSTVRQSTTISRLLDYAATLRVSHSYFVSFYAVSAILCIFWMMDLCFDGHARLGISRLSEATLPAEPVEQWRPVLSLSLLLLHSLRRVYENLYISVPNTKSKMWVGHFAIGLAFFLLLPIAVVAEYTTTPVLTKSLSMTPYETWTVMLTTIIFVGASVWQYNYHAYLASLRKYTLPREYGASQIVAPHYTADCVIYLCLTIINARDGFVDWTMAAVVVFVMVNLGVTAEGTKRWMLNKFRDQQDEIQRRWRMLPGVW